jgi:hypothetical protein
MSSDLRLARHECAHAVAAHLLDRVVLMVSLDGPPVGGGVSIDRAPREPLGHHRRPLAHWYEAETEVLVALAGQLAEGLEPREHEIPLTPQRVPDEPLPRRDAGPAVLPLPVAWQEADEPPVWPVVPQSDDDQVYHLTAGITSSEEERAAVEYALRLRAEAMVHTAHFRACTSTSRASCCAAASFTPQTSGSNYSAPNCDS